MSGASREGARVDECVFCAIVAGRTPAATVLSDEVAVGFLDARPVFKGHVLVVPRVHVETLTDLDDADVGPYFQRVREVARAVEEGLGVAGTFVALNNRVSQSVPHLHTHVVPRDRKDGLRGFFWPRVKYADEGEVMEYAARIQAAIQKSTT
ncbi:HIT family protein [Microtetraspora malaysiensis]|uniref:HIT family protein n=1 Tax=Microtetraspora malaysiensis TaxID=161358 RepID=UPI003D8D866B